MKRKTWQQKEKDDARDFGGRIQPGSGNQWANKLDVKTEDFLIENKTTEKGSYSISLKLWTKVRNASLSEGRVGLVGIRFVRKQLEDLDLVVVDKNDFLSLINNERCDSIPVYE